MTTETLWTGLGLVAPLEARLIGRAPTGVSGISIDTRSLVKGDLFFAIRGENNDGHDFVDAAFQKGCAAAVVDEAHAGSYNWGPLYVVRDTLRAMESLGRAARERNYARIAAITGSVGKTGTKEALRHVLSQQGATHASMASYNNHWGVPLTLARMPRDCAYGVFEIGMNHAGEITPLVGMVRPHVAVITTIAAVHLENFASIDGIAMAKAEIFSGVEAGGSAIIHRDVPQFDLLMKQARAAGITNIFSFGDHAEANARLISCIVDDDGSQVEAEILGRRINFRIAAPGRHLAMNALAVLLAVHELEADVDAAAQALASFGAPAGRGQRIVLELPAGRATLIDESYNANPTSMRAALAVLAAAQTGSGGRRIAVLGDMLELGPEAISMHREIATVIDQSNVDIVYAAGPLMKHMFDALPLSRQGRWAERASELERSLVGAIRPGDVIMVKGSNGSRMAPLVAALKQAYGAALSLRSEG